MSGSRYYGQPIPMDGFRALRVEAQLVPEPGTVPGAASVQVLGTRDEENAKKTWTSKGAAVALREGESVVATFEDLGRFARVEVEAGPEAWPRYLTIRVERIP